MSSSAKEILNDILNHSNQPSRNNIILSMISPIGIIKKRVTSIKELEEEGNLKLISKASSLLTSNDSIAVLPLIGESGIELLHIIEIIRPPKSIIILGAGHVGRYLSIISSMLEFNVTLMDDRERFLTDDNINLYNINKVVSSFDNYTDFVPVGSNCAIVIVTRGHQSDETCLRIAIHTSAKYIGMIGSKRRVLAIINNLKRRNLTEDASRRLDSIFAPIGLEIGAKTPQEIAISILAQIIQVMNN